MSSKPPLVRIREVQCSKSPWIPLDSMQLLALQIRPCYSLISIQENVLLSSLAILVSMLGGREGGLLLPCLHLAEVVTQVRFSRNCKYLYTVSGDR